LTQEVTMFDPDCAVCGGELLNIDGEWFHARIEDFSHTPAPA
jgi:hypothetical protein